MTHIIILVTYTILGILHYIDIHIILVYILHYRYTYYTTGIHITLYVYILRYRYTCYNTDIHITLQVYMLHYRYTGLHHNGSMYLDCEN